MEKVYYFRALKDMPFGIKAGDTFTWRRSTGKLMTKEPQSRVIPMDPFAEPEFFEEYEPVIGPWPVGEIVVLWESGKYQAVHGEGAFLPMVRKQIPLSAWTPYRVKGYVKGPGSVIYAVISLRDAVNTIKYARVNVASLQTLVRYWYIHSSGTEVRSEIWGRFPVSDAFRQRMGLMYETKEIAESELTRIVGDVIETEAAAKAKK